ncbi:hypothetical protein [Haliscomenobacter sp.]|uniref:hypothetical protein n=1 Tax=Haliscomenobacter sp. TaxID=2717303 RepID=UPI003593620C
MKVLSNENLEALQGGILCSKVTEVLQTLAATNTTQLNAVLETFAVFGHGGTYTLQCDPDPQ